MTPREVLETAYSAASNVEAVPLVLSAQQREWVEAIAAKAESQKGILAVTTTSLVKKIVTPEQDVRRHQDKMPGGYSGRTFDTNYITPFLHEKMPRFAMAESGWLTRSLEQNHPYNLDYVGAIRDKIIKNAFLQILNDVEVNRADAFAYLAEMLALLLRQATAAQIVTAPNPDAGQLTIASVVRALRSHFFTKYQGSGASRLPVLAVHSIYAVSMKDEEYADKTLLPLKSHTTSDLRSSSVGDVEIVDADDNFVEAVEVKHDIPITFTLVENAYAKFQQLPLGRYYLLTTASPNSVEEQRLENLNLQIRREHGCEVIVNGVLPTIQYYLRRGKRTAAFLEAYTTAIQEDFAANTDLKETHLRQWNEILKELNAKNSGADNA